MKKIISSPNNLNTQEGMREGLEECYNYVKTCKECGLLYGTVNKGEEHKNLCPVCIPFGMEVVKRIFKRRVERGRYVPES